MTVRLSVWVREILLSSNPYHLRDRLRLEVMTKDVTVTSDVLVNGVSLGSQRGENVLAMGRCEEGHVCVVYSGMGWREYLPLVHGLPFRQYISAAPIDMTGHLLRCEDHDKMLNKERAAIPSSSEPLS